MSHKLGQVARWILLGDAWLIEEGGHQVGWKANCIVASLDDASPDASVVVSDTPQLQPDELNVATVNAACGRAGLEYVRRAVRLCLDGDTDAMATAPLNKASGGN